LQQAPVYISVTNNNHPDANEKLKQPIQLAEYIFRGVGYILCKTISGKED